MGRRKQPINVLVDKGKKHLTKKEIEQRKNEEIQTFSDNMNIPLFLPAQYHEEFNFYLEELKRLEIISNLDMNLLASYVITKNIYEALTLKLNDCMFLGQFEDIKEITTQQDKIFKQFISLSRELGFTISGRLKFTVKKDETETENKTPTEEFFKGRL